MKRIICIVLVLAIALSFSACGQTREAVSAEEFTSRMTEAGHTVEDVSNIFEVFSDSPVVTYLIADCGAFEVEFVVYETVERAQQLHASIRSSLEDMMGGAASSHSEVNTPNFSRYRQTGGGRLGVVSRIGNTVVVVITSSDNRAEVDAVLDLLGY